MQAVAEVIFGRLIPTARMPIKLSRHDDPKTAMKK
jgi:hypothetical protein